MALGPSLEGPGSQGSVCRSCTGGPWESCSPSLNLCSLLSRVGQWHPAREAMRSKCHRATRRAGQEPGRPPSRWLERCRLIAAGRCGTFVQLKGEAKETVSCWNRKTTGFKISSECQGYPGWAWLLEPLPGFQWLLQQLLQRGRGWSSYLPHVPPFLYPLIYQWAFSLLPYLAYCK